VDMACITTKVTATMTIVMAERYNLFLFNILQDRGFDMPIITRFKKKFSKTF
jgi:hypothetical protein